MVKSGSGSGRICFIFRQNPAPAGFPKSKSGTALIKSNINLVSGITIAVFFFKLMQLKILTCAVSYI